MFLDIGAAIILTVPIIFPSLVALGFNPLLLGVLIVIIAELGFITPPVGLNVFVAAGVTGVSIGKAFRAAMPFAAVMLITMVILIAFPQITLFLPNLMK